MSELGTYYGASTLLRKTLDWNLSRISMFEVEAVPHIVYRRSRMGFSMVINIYIYIYIYIHY
jgi:hypothetical protein